MRFTLDTPHDSQMETAFALQAVEKLSLGPTSTMVPPAATLLSDVSLSRSYVSASSHSSFSASPEVSSDVTEML